MDEITNGFIENKYTLGVLIDLSKAFDTVNNSILLEKLHLHGVKGNGYNGSKVTCLTENNIHSPIKNQLFTKLLRAEIHKAQFWDLCCF